MARFRTLIASRKTISGWKNLISSTQILPRDGLMYHLCKQCRGDSKVIVYLHHISSCYLIIIFSNVVMVYRSFQYKHINIEKIDNNQSWIIVYIKERATLLQMYTSLVNKRWYQEDSATPTRLKTLILYCNMNKTCL